MKTQKLQHYFRVGGIFVMQILYLISAGYYLAFREWAWAINFLGNFLLWTLVLILSLQRDRYLRELLEVLDFLEELPKKANEKSE